MHVHCQCQLLNASPKDTFQQAGRVSCTCSNFQKIDQLREPVQAFKTNRHQIEPGNQRYLDGNSACVTIAQCARYLRSVSKSCTSLLYHLCIQGKDLYRCHRHSQAQMTLSLKSVQEHSQSNNLADIDLLLSALNFFSRLAVALQKSTQLWATARYTHSIQQSSCTQ